MHRWGHLGSSLLTYAPFGGALVAAGRERLALLGGAVAATCATVPDLDEAVPGVDHRGPTHTLWFALGLGTVLVASSVAADAAIRRVESRRVAPHRPDVLRALVVGGAGVASTATHVAVDSLTPMGVRPFAPLWERYYGFDVVLSRNRRWNLALLATGLLATAVTALGGRLLAARD